MPIPRKSLTGEKLAPNPIDEGYQDWSNDSDFLQQSSTQDNHDGL